MSKLMTMNEVRSMICAIVEADSYRLSPHTSLQPFAFKEPERIAFAQLLAHRFDVEISDATISMINKATTVGDLARVAFLATKTLLPPELLESGLRVRFSVELAFPELTQSKQLPTEHVITAIKKGIEAEMRKYMFMPDGERNPFCTTVVLNNVAVEEPSK